MNDYRLHVSSSSCYLDEIENFVYGPFTSRFWMLRKHLILHDHSKCKKMDMPFYAWDCITLSIRDKWDLHLLIPNEKIMSMFIKLLIYSMESIDGQRGTSTHHQQQLLKREIKLLKDATKSLSSNNET